MNVSLLYLASFSSSLPRTIPNTTASSPVWVVEIQGGGVDPSNLRAPVTITFPTPAQVRPALDVSFD